MQGLGGAAVALPALEYNVTRSAAAAPAAPKRYVYMFAGTSTGRKHHYADTESQDLLAPDAAGTGYDLKRVLAPLGDFGVQDDVSVVSGLELPWGSGGSIPAGGRHVRFHAGSLCPLVCGTRSSEEAGMEEATAATSDQIVAQHIAGDTPHPVLAYRVQAAYYRGGNGQGGDRGRITYREADDGSIEPIDPIVSPRLAYESLFGGFVPPDSAEQESARRDFVVRTSALDVVHGATQRLMPKLGMADRHRLQRHLDEVASLQSRLDELSLPTGGDCMLPPNPGEDPPLGQANESTGDAYETTAGYSNEELRAELLCDLVHMAFACDLSRVGSVMLTMAQCFMNMHPLFGHPTDFHEASHGSANNGEGLEWLSDGCAWHVKHFARLISKLRDTTDFDGHSLLDNTAVVLVFEGGHGYDPETQNDAVPHSTENMAALIGGRAGGLNSGGGKHVVTQAAHPVQLVNTAMKAVGAPAQLGEVTGTIAGLGV